MPYVDVRVTKTGVTAEQKRKIVKDITKSLVSTLGKKPEHIHIVIDEVELENWGFAGQLTSDLVSSTKPSKVASFTPEYVLPRLRKLKPATRDAVVHSIAAMFQFQKKVGEKQIESFIDELVEAKALRIDPKGKVEIKEA